MFVLKMETKSVWKRHPKVKVVFQKWKLLKVSIFKVEVAKVCVFRVKVAKVHLDVFLMLTISWSCLFQRTLKRSASSCETSSTGSSCPFLGNIGDLVDVGQCCAWHERVPFFSDINYNNLSICLEYKWLVQHFHYLNKTFFWAQFCVQQAIISHWMLQGHTIVKPYLTTLCNYMWHEMILGKINNSS